MQLPIKIRRAERSDAQTIAELMVGMGFDHSANEIERRWNLLENNQQDHVLLAEEEGTPVGLIAIHISPLLFYPRPLARITTLVVDQMKRRQGVGRSLVNEAVVIARKSGCDTIELTTGSARKEAHEFYRSLGFQNSALRMSYKL